MKSLYLGFAAGALCACSDGARSVSPSQPQSGASYVIATAVSSDSGASTYVALIDSLESSRTRSSMC
jgi:hypothetical protein